MQAQDVQTLRHSDGVCKNRQINQRQLCGKKIETARCSLLFITAKKNETARPMRFDGNFARPMVFEGPFACTPGFDKFFQTFPNLTQRKRKCTCFLFLLDNTSIYYTSLVINKYF